MISDYLKDIQEIAQSYTDYLPNLTDGNTDNDDIICYLKSSLKFELRKFLRPFYWAHSNLDRKIRQKEKLSFQPRLIQFLKYIKEISPEEKRKNLYLINSNIIMMKFFKAGQLDKTLVTEYLRLLKDIKREKDYQFHYFSILLNKLTFMQVKPEKKVKRFLMKLQSIADRILLDKQSFQYKYIKSYHTRLRKLFPAKKNNENE